MDTTKADTGLDLEKLEALVRNGKRLPLLSALALIAAAKREEMRNRHEGTHAPDCHLWGPKHYDCLRGEFDKQAAELAAANARIAELERETAR